MKKILTALVAILTSGILGLTAISNTKTVKANENDTPVVTLGTSLPLLKNRGQLIL